MKRTPHDQDRPRRVWRWVVAITAVLFLVVTAVLGPRLYGALSLLNAGDEIDIGGREVFIHCEGTGSPTVILEHGLGSNGHEWQTVQSGVAEHTRVCWTSRAGMGFSDPAPDSQPRSAQDAADDLTAVLDAADIGGPYVMVGHSFGGYVVRLFTAEHADEVVGVVLVDTMHDQQLSLLQDRLSTSALSELSVLFSTDNPENMDIVTSAEQVGRSPDLGARPLVVLEAAEQSTVANAAGVSQTTASELDAIMATLWPEFQADLAALSTAGTHEVVSGSGHFIQRDDPATVVDAITLVLDQITAR